MAEIPKESREALEALKKQGYTVPELDPNYSIPSRRGSQRSTFFARIPQDKMPEGYYQCARCGRLLSDNHFTKNKTSCRECNGLASQASVARVRGLSFTPTLEDASLRQAHPAFPASPERAKEWQKRQEDAAIVATAAAAAVAAENPAD